MSNPLSSAINKDSLPILLDIMSTNTSGKSSSTTPSTFPFPGLKGNDENFQKIGSESTHSHHAEEEVTTISNRNVHPLLDNIQWKKFDNTQYVLYVALIICSGGLFWLFGFLYPIFLAKFLSIESSPEDADIAIIVMNQKYEFISQIEHFQNPVKRNEKCLVLECDCLRFCASNLDNYRLKQVPIIPTNYSRYLKDSMTSSLTSSLYSSSQLAAEYAILIAQYGYNKMKVPDETFLEIGIRHLLSPFYIFQYFAVIVWYVEDYWLFATLILIITLSAVYFTTKESVHNLKQLRELVGSQNKVDIINFRGNNSKNSDPENPKKSISSQSDTVLVPGDIFLIQEGMILPCDAILIAGKVLVDESMLTGESIPVCKVPLDPHVLDADDELDQALLEECRIPNLTSLQQQQQSEQGKGKAGSPEEELDKFAKLTGNILFSGTKAKVLYGDECYAVVYKTSFRSAKGQLVASLLKPKEGFITFISDAVNSILFMLLLVTCVYIVTAYLLYEHHLPLGEVIFRYLDAISIAVPPALTACLTISTGISIERLKEKNIFVADTTRLNFAGVINTVCFDKTGTLTESNLQFLGVYCCIKGWKHSEFLDYTLNEEERIHSDHPTTSTTTTTFPYECQLIMATCHSLAFEKNSTNAIGDPLEVELYQASKWTLKTSSSNSQQFYVIPPTTAARESRRYDILKHFEFTPERLRAASIVQDSLTNQFHYLLKGSPEIIMKMCDPDSLPANISQKLSFLSCKGYRVIALASKECSSDVISLSQIDIEKDLSSPLLFYGLVYLSSTLKKDTKKTIRLLKQANISVNMITGDHINTAIAVAEDCGIIKPMNTNSKEIEYQTYIIDEDSSTGQVKVFDVFTLEEIPTLTLSEVIYNASKAYLLNFIELNEQVIEHNSNGTMVTSILPTYNPLASITSSSVSHLVPTSTPPTGSPVATRGKKTLKTVSLDSPSMDDETTAVDGTTNTPNKPTSSSSSSKLLKVQLAVTGKALRNLQEKAEKSPYHRQLVKNLVHYAKIFARMKPHDKKAVVESLKESHQFEMVDHRHQQDALSSSSLLLGGSGDEEAQLVTNVLHQSPPTLVTNTTRRSASIHDEDSLAQRPSTSLQQNKTKATMNNNHEEDSSSLSLSHQSSSLPQFSKHQALFLKDPQGFLSTFPENGKNASISDFIFGETLDVLFCGDGANDMVALRAATIGVSLCDSETSVAAPITSKIQSPFSVIEVLLEGRCSLITAYVLILFTLEYGVIQLFFTLELYYYGLLVGDYMYIIQDLFYTLILGYTMCKALPSKNLSIQLPPKRFLILQNICKFFAMILCYLGFQLFTLGILNLQSFYYEYHTDDPLTQTYAYESSVLFNISLGQVMIASIVSSIDEPFRQSWIKNPYHTICLGLEVLWLFLQIFIQSSGFFESFLEIKPVPVTFGLIEVAILILHFLVCYGITKWIDWFFLVKYNKVWYKEMDYYSIKKSLMTGKI